MKARQDNTAAQLVAGHVKPLPDTADAGSSNRQAAAPSSGRDATVHHDAIAAEAYALWARRGCQDGHDLEDWLEAERRLRATAGTGGDAAGFR